MQIIKANNTRLVFKTNKLTNMLHVGQRENK